MMLQNLLLLGFVSYCSAVVLSSEAEQDLEKDPMRHPDCTAQAGEIKKLPYNSGTWMNIFVDVAFSCPGRIFKWRLYSQNAGGVFLTVWRPQASGTAWDFVGKNYVWTTSGVNDIRIPSCEQIEVQAGDVIGVQYKKDDPSATVPTERGSISYENDDNFPWWTKSRTFSFSRIVNPQLFDDDIDTSVPRTDPVRPFKRMAALAAYVKSPCGIELGPRTNLTYNSGQWLNVYLNQPINCHGKLVRWEFFAKLTGTMYLSVWEGDMTAGFTLKGYNRIRVNSTGPHCRNIPPRHQIDVSPNDVLGIFYPDRPASATTDRGIIPYENNEDFPWWTTRLTHLEMHNVDVQFSSIVGTSYLAKDHRQFKRYPALAAFVERRICAIELGPRQNLTYNSGQWLNVFVDKPINCSGKLVRWEFFAKLTGTMYLSVWQGDMTAGFRLKGYNEITVTRNGTHNIRIPRRDQIDVSPSDVLGIFYPDRPAGATTDRGIIPYENNDDFPWWTTRLTHIEMHNVDVQFSSIVGTHYLARDHRPFKRYPALAAFVEM